MALNMISTLSPKLDAYVQWSKTSTSGNRLAGLTGTGDAGRIQNLKGIPRGQQSVARQAALDDFRRALTDTVGESLANQVWRDVAGNKKKGLSASLIAKTIVRANDLLQKTLTHPKSVLKNLFNLRTEEIVNAVNGRKLPTAEFKRQCRISVAVMRANALLGMTPISRGQVEVFRSHFNNVMNQLVTCWDEARAAQPQPLAGRLESLMGELSEKMEAVDRSADRMPGSKESLRKLAEHWTAALVRACDTLSSGMPGSQPQIDRLNSRLQELKSKMSRDGAMLAFLKTHRKETKGKLQGLLNGCITSTIGKKGLNQLINGTRANDFLSKTHGDILNEAAWEPISNQFEGALGGRKLTLRSDIVSGGRINGMIADRYGRNVNAYNAHSMGTPNAVNLATSKFTVTDEDGTSRTVFNGVRHGVHSAQDIQNPRERAEANAERARQTVIAAFTTYLESHLDEAKKLAAHGQEIPFNMTSVSLLTPTSVHSNEKSMLKDQKAAWDAVDGKTLEITVGDMKYKVRPSILTFNYGVDYYSVDAPVRVGWDAADKVNDANIIGLRSRVVAFCRRQPEGTSERKAIETLWRQISDIYNSKTDRTADHEAYKMPARIAVLTYLMGDVPVWNCKSGKDRTGMLDVEAKFLATLIAQGQEIPEPGAKLTPEQSQLLNTIAMKSGNLEMQEYNTGISGYKLYGGASTFERLGAGSAEKKAVLGGASYVGS